MRLASVYMKKGYDTATLLTRETNSKAQWSIHVYNSFVVICLVFSFVYKNKVTYADQM